MLFSSITFLFYFLPVFLLVYAVARGKWKNLVLLLASLLFYAWGEPKYVILMAVSVALGFVLGLLIEKYRHTAWRWRLTALAAALHIGILFYFKYTNFFLSNLGAVVRAQIPLLSVTLPIGISFYTFQILSYELDVAKGEVKAQRNFIDLAAYISMFPQLIAGPIVRYSDIEQQMQERTHNAQKISYGIFRFSVGLAKKVILANTLGEIVAAYNAADAKTVLYAWLYALAATLQIYYDFSGYSDMAIGLGSVMGFSFPENFRHPLASKSATEFWRRWHITLGSWFRDYLYIPLGGNRVSHARWILNILIVWMATGLWHGASWNFVLWGLLFAVFLILEKKFLGRWLERRSVLGHIYLLVLILVSFVIFEAADFSQIAQNLGILFGVARVPAVSPESLFALRDYGVVLIAAFAGALGIPFSLCKKWRESARGAKVLNVLEPLAVALFLVTSVSFLINGSFNPFLYFRF